MKHIVYKIMNNLNSKIYIGVHSTEDVSDSYMGSGVNIKKSIAKHGVENFSKDILFIFDSYDEMLAKEAELVDEAFVLRTDTYNAAIGGLGAPWKMAHRDDAEELRRKISKNTSLGMTNDVKKRIAKSKTGSKHSKKTKDLISKTISDAYHGSPMDRTGSKISLEHKAAISKALKGRENKVSIVIKGIQFEYYSKAAEHFNVTGVTIRNWIKDGKEDCYKD